MANKKNRIEKLELNQPIKTNSVFINWNNKEDYLKENRENEVKSLERLESTNQVTCINRTIIDVIWE